MKRETEIASDIIYELRQKHKCFVINIAGSKFQQPGLPDCLIIRNGSHIFVEFKSADGDFRQIQKNIIKQMKVNGAIVRTVRFQTDKIWILDERIPIYFNTFKEGVSELLGAILCNEEQR